MSGYDIIDEAYIDSSPDLVWHSLVAELSGAASFWLPFNTFESSGPADELGTTVKWTVHPKGKDKGGPKLRFTSRTVSVVPGRRLTAEYFEGVFRGTADFTVEPVNGGLATRVSLHFTAQPQGLAKVLSKVADIGQKHSDATQLAFANLNTVIGGRHTSNGVHR
ncbi:SRPBCC family protein [Actinocrispum wychmicini]|uniref:Polyketide cyclase/dehydrase/lipid transport protein n=1 Tax=Actinocrispum wychmicini TaxID=1213861 RepID=A0A4R2J862_9PSEU|nr:SRPBCC family protein [Actinocrispum wychmicini]TCO52816.1 polyketide cyclase/dehydrase/lipid transport protein [Actinocrispum wychmicini]